MPAHRSWTGFFVERHGAVHGVVVGEELGGDGLPPTRRFIASPAVEKKTVLETSEDAAVDSSICSGSVPSSPPSRQSVPL